MVVVTWVIALFTASTVFVGVLSYRVIDGQLDVMRRQLEEMQSGSEQSKTLIDTNKNLADAAARSADIAERALKTTQRAYLLVAPKLKGFVAEDYPEGEILVRNIGTTPAYSVRIRTFIGVASYPLPDSLRLSEQISGSAHSSVMTKDEALSGKVRLKTPLQKEHHAQIDNNGAWRLLLWGVIEFDDAFGCKIRRNVCFSYGGESARKGQDPELCSGERNVQQHLGDCRF
jgi:hypothetical protein